MRYIIVIWLGIFSALAGCTMPERPAVDDASGRPKVALVLGGGAARGFAHVGVIRALEQEKIPIDMVIGTSVGSLIGALYAHDGNSFELEWEAFSLEKEDLFDYALLGAGMGPVKGDRLEAFITAKVPVAHIEQLKIPFAAVATDLNRGSRVVLDRGPLAKAVRASCAIPGVFQPVMHQGRLLVDGGVIDNLPAAVAREKGADIVIAVDISQNVTNYNIGNLVDVTLQSVAIMFRENVANRRKDADIVISPAVGHIAMLDFTKKKQSMQAGIEAGRQAIPLIRKAMDDWAANRARKTAGK